MSINEVRYLPECGSTNAYVKEHFEEFGPVGAVYTENQTAGRGRLGRSWVNAEGKALYYTVAIREPLAQPATLPLLASLAVRTQLRLRYGVDCQIKWPNDLLLNGKKIVGILCESVSYGYQQQVVGPFYPAVHAVALGQLIADGEACQQRQGGRLGQRLPDDRRIIEGAALGVHPAAAKTAPACGLIGGVYRAHRAELLKMLFRVSVGAAALGQPAHLVDAHALGTSLCSWLTTLPSARVRMP